MPKTLTLNDVAGLIADAEGAPSKVVPTVLRRVRSFDAKELLPVEREDAGRREGRLALDGACLAYVYSELTDLGFDAAMLRDVRAAIGGQHRPNSNESDWLAAIRKIKGGEEVHLSIEMAVRRDGHFRKWPIIKIIGLREQSARFAAIAQNARDQKGVVIRTTVSVNLTLLLSGFIASFHAAED